MYERFSDRSNRLGIEAFDTMMAGMSRQDSINLGGGTLHPTLTPLQQLFSLMERIPSADLGRIMAYCPARGLPEMIEAHREYLSAFRRFTAAEDEVCIVNGGTQGLDLVLQAILDPGDVMLVEQPTFLTIYPLARKLQVRCVGVDLESKTSVHHSNVSESVRDRAFEGKKGKGLRYSQEARLVHSGR